MKDVVVFASDSAGGVLALVRSIKKEFNVNTYVICINSSFSAIFNASRYVTQSIEIHSEFEDVLFENFQLWVEEKKFHEKPVLYFSTDHSCLFVNNYRSWFETNFILTLPSYDIIKTYNFKGVAEFDARKNGLQVPETINLSTTDDLKIVIKSFKFPVIIKPTSALTKKNIGFKAKTFKDKETFQQFTESLFKNGKSVICQEYIPGGDDKAYYYIFYRDAKGNIYENIGIKILQCPPSQGIMAVGVSCFNENISEISKSFLRKINYVGIGGIEFKEYNGNYYFIEMSTRPEGFFLITEVSDVPISKISYLNLSNLPVEIVYKQSDGIKYIDLISMIAARKLQKKYWLLVKELFIALFNKNTYFNTISISDIKPFIILLKTMLYKKINKDNKFSF